MEKKNNYNSNQKETAETYGTHNEDGGLVKFDTHKAYQATSRGSGSPIYEWISEWRVVEMVHKFYHGIGMPWRAMIAYELKRHVT